MKPVPEPKKPRGFDDKSRGSTIIEFAAVLPLFAVLLLVTVDAGMLIREHQLLQNAAREAARISALPENRMELSQDAMNVESRIKQRAVMYLQEENISIGVGDVTVDQDEGIVIDGILRSASEVRINYDRNLLILGGSLLPAGPVTLTGRAVFRNFY